MKLGLRPVWWKKVCLGALDPAAKRRPGVRPGRQPRAKWEICRAAERRSFFRNSLFSAASTRSNQSQEPASAGQGRRSLIVSIPISEPDGYFSFPGSEILLARSAHDELNQNYAARSWCALLFRAQRAQICAL